MPRAAGLVVAALLLVVQSATAAAAGAVADENSVVSRREAPLHAPRVDHHVHLLSDGVIEAFSGRPLASVKVPAAIDRLLQKRAAAWNDQNALSQLFAVDARIVVDQSNKSSGIFIGPEVAADHLSTRFARPYMLTPVSFRMAGGLAHVLGYYTRGEASSPSRFGYFSMSLVRAANRQWKIASEAPSFPRARPMTPVDAEKLIAMLDEAGIERGVVHSAAVAFGGKWVDLYRTSQRVEERQQLVMKENDWNAAQAARYPGRLLSFCSFHLLDAFAINEMRRCRATGHVGVKLHFDVDGTDFLNPMHREQARKVFSAANELRMPIMAHIQNNEGSVDDTMTRYRFFLDEVVSAAPDVTVQIAHLWGGGDFSEAGLEAFAALAESGHPSVRNMYFDIGDVPRVVLENEPAAAQAMAKAVVTQARRIGVHRILFGSDGGMEGFHTPAQSWQALVQHFPFSTAELSIIAANEAPYTKK